MKRKCARKLIGNFTSSLFLSPPILENVDRFAAGPIRDPVVSKRWSKRGVSGRLQKLFHTFECSLSFAQVRASDSDCLLEQRSTQAVIFNPVAQLRGHGINRRFVLQESGATRSNIVSVQFIGATLRMDRC